MPEQMTFSSGISNNLYFRELDPALTAMTFAIKVNFLDFATILPPMRSYGKDLLKGKRKAGPLSKGSL
jgi:hypothetical protein